MISNQSLAEQSTPLAKADPKPVSASWRDYFMLTKPTITLLVIVTVVPGLLMPLGLEALSMKLIVATLFGTWLASSSAAVFNHFVDSDIDQQMNRTRRRPVAAGRVHAKTAFAFATVLGLASIWVLLRYTTPMATFVAVFANFFYVVIYTMYLKPRTVQNIVIGGAAGAVGPLIGWAAVTGDIGWPAWVLFAVIFFWTPPHFWALALKYKDDYKAAGVPMMPVVRGDDVTRWQMLLYSISLIPLVASLYVFKVAGLVYFIPSLALTLYFVILAYKLWVSKDNLKAMPLFHYSCLYLFGVFGALMIDRLI